MSEEQQLSGLEQELFGRLRAAILTIRSDGGPTPMRDVLVPKKKHQRIDVSDFQQPINGYQVKQRKRKQRKKGV